MFAILRFAVDKSRELCLVGRAL